MNPENNENPLGPEMETDYQSRKARFYAAFEKKRQEAEATFKRYETYFREKGLPPFKTLSKDEDMKVICGSCQERVYAALLPDHYELRHPEAGFTADSFRDMVAQAEIVEIEDPDA